MLRVRLVVQQVEWTVGSGEWTRASGEWSVVVVCSVYCVLCNVHVNYVIRFRELLSGLVFLYMVLRHWNASNICWRALSSTARVLHG